MTVVRGVRQSYRSASGEHLPQRRRTRGAVASFRCVSAQTHGSADVNLAPPAARTYYWRAKGSKCRVRWLMGTRSPEILLARQAIVDRQRTVVGYELLHRSGDHATAMFIDDAL